MLLFWEGCIHFISLIALQFRYCNIYHPLRYAELGILTIMIHDASDPLLETTRLFSHLSAHKKSGHLFKTISSVTLVIFLFEW